MRACGPAAHFGEDCDGFSPLNARKRVCSTTTMKTYLHCFSILAVFSAFADGIETNNWGATTNGVQVSIGLSGGGEKITINQPVKLVIRFKNVSTNEILNVSRQSLLESDDSYSFVVISQSGQDVSPSAKPRFIPGSGTSIRIAPRQVKAVQYELSRRCKFDEIGAYKVIAKIELKLLGKSKMFQAVSSPLCVSIVPDAPNSELP